MLRIRVLCASTHDRAGRGNEVQVVIEYVRNGKSASPPAAATGEAPANGLIDSVPHLNGSSMETGESYLPRGKR
jgi:hypothetical protein